MLEDVNVGPFHASLEPTFLSKRARMRLLSA